MKTVELFAGTGSFSKVAESKGNEIFCVDKFEGLGRLDAKVDLLDNEECEWLAVKLEKDNIDFMWCSPPCTTFSVASLGHHWTGGKGAYIPKTEKCKDGLKLLENTIRMIARVKPTYWVIENPRGVMRKVIGDLFKKFNLDCVQRNTVTYCQYGDNRMKPTDLWCNFKWETKPMCKNGSPCHEPAPRGSKTGTQGLKNNKERSVIPPALFEEMFEQLRTLEDV